MSREHVWKFGWIAPALLLVLLAALLLRPTQDSKEPKPRSATSKMQVQETTPSLENHASRNPASTERKQPRLRAEDTEEEDELEVHERSAADVIAADPLKSSLKTALTRFASLKSYSYLISVTVYENGKPILETKSGGQVKDQQIVMGLTEVQGEVFEVASRGAESRIRRPGEEWSEAENGWYEAGEVDPRAAEMAEAWADPVLASMPLRSAPTENVGGVDCSAMTLNLEGALPGDENVKSGSGASAVTFVVDPDGQIRRWRLTMEMNQDGKKMKTVAEADFSGFDAPWTVPLPEWMQ